MKEYVELCFLADREPDSVEFLAIQMFGIMPDWVKEMTDGPLS